MLRLKPFIFMCSSYNICCSHCKLVYKGIYNHVAKDIWDKYVTTVDWVVIFSMVSASHKIQPQAHVMLLIHCSCLLLCMWELYMFFSLPRPIPRGFERSRHTRSWQTTTPFHLELETLSLWLTSKTVYKLRMTHTGSSRLMHHKQDGLSIHVLLVRGWVYIHDVTKKN